MKMKRIGIYARGLSDKAGGTRNMIWELTSRIPEYIAKEDMLYIIHNCKKRLIKARKNVIELILPSLSKVLCDYYHCPYLIKKHNIQRIWLSKPVIPFFYDIK